MTHAHNFRDITGIRFGRLTAIRFVGLSGNRTARWIFRCDCGTEFETDGWSVTRGRTRSCGCLRRETARDNAPAPPGRPCTVVDPDGIRHIFASRKEAAAWMGVCPETITRHAGGTFRNHTIL